MERGATRSGRVYSKRNKAYYASEREALKAHPRLLDPLPAVTTRHMSIGNSSVAKLTQTTVRFLFNSDLIKSTLRMLFVKLITSYPATANTGYEVVVTFNALLADHKSSTYTVFYGHDHREDNDRGASRELGFGDTVIVKNISDVGKIPTSFDHEQLLSSHREAFKDSGVRIVRYLNVVYLVYRWVLFSFFSQFIFFKERIGEKNVFSAEDLFLLTIFFLQIRARPPTSHLQRTSLAAVRNAGRGDCAYRILEG
jgi:hypothetical protein